MSAYTPVIRDDLLISEQEDSGDETAYIIKDPGNDSFYRFKAPEYFIVKQLDGSNSLEDINRKVETEFDAPLPDEVLTHFISSLHQRGLLKTQQQLDDVPPPLDVVAKKETSKGSYLYVKHPNGKTYRFREMDYFIVEQLNMLVSPDVIRNEVSERFNRDISEEYILKVTRNLLKRGLAVEEPEQKAEVPLKQKRVRGNLLYLRTSFFDPDRLFDRLVVQLGFLFTREFVVFSAAVIAAAVFILFTNGNQVATGSASLFQIKTLFLVWFLIVPVTILHEFAHGLTCKHFGGRVREIGFLMIFFQPALYCNVSDAWLFKERYKRIWVGLAGVYFEMFLWALAVFVWRISAPETWVNYVALVLMGTSGFRIALNLIPLIKLDGYYVLSDFLQIPNMRAKAFAYIANGAKSALGMNYVMNDGGLSARERRIYVSYGLIAGIFTILLLGYIGVKVAGFLVDQYQGTGFIIFSTVLMTVIGYPMYLRVSKKQQAEKQSSDNAAIPSSFTKFRKRTLNLLFLGSLIALLFIGEMDLKVAGEFTVYPSNNADIRTEVSGIIETVYVSQGDSVKAGDKLADLSDRDYQAELRKLDAEIAEKKAKKQKYQEQLKYAVKKRKNFNRLKKHNAIPKNKIDDADRDVAITKKSIKEIDAELVRLDVQKKYLEGQLTLLTITSPIDGVVTSSNIREKVGQHLNQGDMLVEIHQIQKMKVEILVPEKEIGDVTIGQEVLLKARAYPGKTFSGNVMVISPIVENYSEYSTFKVVKVITEIDNQDLLLKKDMTGQAKIICGTYKIIELVTRKLYQYIKVEFWSWW